MIYAIYIALVVVAFFTVLNGYLRGAKKAQIDAVLGVLLIGLVIAAYVVSGWKMGLLSIAVAFLSAVVTRPIAARTASRLPRLLVLSMGASGRYIGLPPHHLERICQQLGRQINTNKLAQEMLRGADRRANAEKALLDYCESQAAIQDIMNEFQVSREGLKEIYFQLIALGAGQWRCGHWVAASALAYPETLRYVLARRNEITEEIAFKLIMYFEQGSPLE